MTEKRGKTIRPDLGQWNLGTVAVCCCIGYAAGWRDEVSSEYALSRERLRAMIAHFTPDQQQVLLLRFGEGLNARETAQVLQKTTRAVEALQHRALAALRRALTEKAPV
jgi:RNA polymerase sigma factor (sigma-70 family)